MNPLRQQMINLMTYLNFSPKTHQAYLGAVTQLAIYYHRSPERISVNEIQTWLMFLFLEKHLAPASVLQASHGIKFFFHQVLGKEETLLKLTMPKKAQKIPELLTPDEVNQIISASTNRKAYSMLSLCYGCGLRLSEMTVICI